MLAKASPLLHGRRPSHLNNGTLTGRSRRSERGRKAVTVPKGDSPPNGTLAKASLVLQELVVRHVAHDACRIADDELARRDVLGHDGARSDERLLADLDAREEDRAAADARTASDRRSPHQLLAPLGAAHEVVVRRHDARRDEDVLL